MDEIKLNDSGVVLYSDPREYRDGDGNVYSGITGMIGGKLFPNMYTNVPEWILKRAGARGDKIHDDLQTTDMFGLCETQEQKWWLAIKEEHGIEVINNEYIVTNYKGHATPIDKVAKIKGKLCLIDVKTTAVLNTEYVSWQNSLGKMFFEIVNPTLKIEEIYILHIKEEAQLIPVDIIPDEHLNSLIDAEINGTDFINPYAPTLETEEKATALIRSIADIDEAIKYYTAQKDELKVTVEKIFKKQNIDSWKTDLFTITKIKPTKRVGFDAKRFEKENPDIVKNYQKTTSVKGSIRITPKKTK